MVKIKNEQLAKVPEIANKRDIVLLGKGKTRCCRGRIVPTPGSSSSSLLMIYAQCMEPKYVSTTLSYVMQVDLTTNYTSLVATPTNYT